MSWTKEVAFGALVSAVALVAPMAAHAQSGALGASSETGVGGSVLRAPADRVDPVAHLLRRLEEGSLELARDPVFGYLPAVLAELDVPVSSQSLVFSRTSLQVDMIAPWAPRAIYFNDDVYVGYTVDGLVLEIASVDPEGGSVFYTLDQTKTNSVELRRDELTCKGCHHTGITGGVPGVMMRSYLADRMGNSVVPIDERPTDDRTPMEKRFGGWYVTGTHTLPHAGNTRAEAMVHEIDQPTRFLETFAAGAGGNVRSLEGRFDASFYLTEGSDIVALLVLAHQTRVHNLITIAAEVAEEALAEKALMHLTPGVHTEADGLTTAASDRVDYAVRALVRGMLFYRAEPIGEVEGTGTFATDCASRGPRDTAGRSLRDLSLHGRLFEYPLSFLIYSDAWDALPSFVKDRAYGQMLDILTGEDDPDFPLLDGPRRRTLIEILHATKPDFAAYLEARTAP